ncbi:MAG: branched-chain amino acid ABC transporter substrate-binding protein [Thermodesulfobacteriota bacterium]
MTRRLIVVLTLVIAACVAFNGSVMAANPVIKIATQSPLSGDQSVVGVDIKRGAELALEQLSGPLTKMGFKVELAPFDDQANPDTGVANAKRIVADPAILAVVGHYNSGVQIPSSEVYHTSNLANVSPANTNPKVTTRGYLEVNRIVGRDDVQGVVGADFAAGKNVKSVFVVHDKTAYGQGIAEFFKKRAAEKGMKVLGFEGTEEKANFDALLSPIIAGNPDAVYFGGMYSQAAVMFKQAREKGYMGMFISDDGFDSSDAVKIAGQTLLDGAGTFYSTVSGPANIYPGTAKFVADFKAKFNAAPQPFAAQGYDSMAICLKAIEEAAKAAGNKMPTRQAVAKQIRALKEFKGITGTFTFNEIGDPTVAKYFVIQVTSADPAKWNDNPVVQTLDIAPPK